MSNGSKNTSSNALQSLHSEAVTDALRVTRPTPAALKPAQARAIAADAPLTAAASASLPLSVRRGIFAVLVTGTVLLLAGWLTAILAADGLSWLDMLLIAALVIEAPWSVHNAWNALVGFIIARFTENPTTTVFPPAARAHATDKIFTRTAVLMTLRNEDCERAFARFRTIKDSLDETGQGRHFDYFVLSDSSDAGAIAAEEAAMEAWRGATRRPAQLYYRRREENVGYKAGNVYDFCERYGADYDFMIPLDADSLMTGETILRLVRIVQANPKIGLLQSLISGTPSRSFFERLLHFGPRHGARLFILGSTWWQGGSGPFWGHNALIRVAPFTKHCRLPILRGKPPLGGHILSHDQVEAVLMQRGGYEVRVLPEEQGSFEDNPPTILEFLRRHLRWCQGNLQYLKLRHEPGVLQPKASRFYLWLALELFFSMAGMVAFVVLAAIAAAAWPRWLDFPAASAIALYATWLAIYFMPKIAGTLDALFYESRRYGGRRRLVFSSALEILGTFLLTPIANLASSIFMIGLLFGRKAGWSTQRRDSHAIPWTTAAAVLWPQTVFGLALLGYLMMEAPSAVAWFLPFAAGLVGAIPFAVVTSLPSLGNLAVRWKILALPEEVDPPAELAAVTPFLDGSPALPPEATA